ncbi:MAG: membrane protein insertase YidC [Bacteroidales bacterium]|nr:membrane protein insertase YidC [Bacteroidales bacterium]
MNRNTIIGLVLVFGLMIAYSYLTKPSKEELAQRKWEQDSISLVQMYKQDSIRIAEATIKAEEEKRKGLQGTSVTQLATPSAEETKAVDRDIFGVFANSAQGEQKSYFIESDLMKLEISSLGGKIISVELKEYKTYDTLPLILFDPESVEFGFSFFSNNRIINTDQLYFEPFWYQLSQQGKDHLSVQGANRLQFGMRMYTSLVDSIMNPDQYVEYLYTVTGDNYMIDLTVNLIGMEEVIASNTRFLDFIWNAEMNRMERGVDRFNGSTIYYKYVNDDVDYLSETKDDDESLKTRVKWISFKQRFFSSALIAKDYFTNVEIKTFTNPEKEGTGRYLKSMGSQLGIPYNFTATESIPFSFYFGPLKFKTLTKYDLDLERQIPLGWSFFLLAWVNRFAVIPVFDFLSGFGWNYGIIILVLTILLKLVLFPIAYKTYMSQAKMRVLKPEIEEITAKFPKKEDAMKKQKATMALYKQAGVNPMAGCVPMLLQFPILIALFRFFPSSIELRQESFLWATDLSTYDSILNLPWDIPFYGDHVSLFTILMTVSTLIYTKLNNQMMSGQQQVQGMKTMMYMMPIMFLGFFNSYASALSYYYLLANLITFAQMFVFRKVIDEDKIRLKIQVNKKKPKKKSGFQKRLEDMAKQKGYKK